MLCVVVPQLCMHLAFQCGIKLGSDFVQKRTRRNTRENKVLNELLSFTFIPHTQYHVYEALWKDPKQRTSTSNHFCSPTWFAKQSQFHLFAWFDLTSFLFEKKTKNHQQHPETDCDTLSALIRFSTDLFQRNKQLF